MKNENFEKEEHDKKISAPGLNLQPNCKFRNFVNSGENSFRATVVMKNEDFAKMEKNMKKKIQNLKKKRNNQALVARVPR